MPGDTHKRIPCSDPSDPYHNLFIDQLQKNEQQLSPIRPSLRWVKSTLKEAGIDICTFSAHSSRTAASSYSLSSGLPLKEILKAGGWSNANIFVRHYNKLKTFVTNFCNQVFIRSFLKPLLTCRSFRSVNHSGLCNFLTFVHSATRQSTHSLKSHGTP